MLDNTLVMPGAGSAILNVASIFRPNINITLAEGAVPPNRAHETDAGADLRSITSITILPGTKLLVDTGVSMQIPMYYVGLVTPRSSMGKVEVSLANTVGVIDSDYRGTIKLFLKNNGTEPFSIIAGDTRIGQILIVPVLLARFNVVNKIDDTSRGVGGFGSTGI